MIKQDIEHREDIERIVSLFYEKVRADEVIGFFFSDAMIVNWDKHLHQMCAFWENILFFTGDYEGNPLVTHRKLHEKHPTNPAHFKRWQSLFEEVIDAHYTGVYATKMKDHARSIATIMQSKI